MEVDMIGAALRPLHQVSELLRGGTDDYGEQLTSSDGCSSGAEPAVRRIATVPRANVSADVGQDVRASSDDVRSSIASFLLRVVCIAMLVGILETVVGFQEHGRRRGGLR